MVVVWLYGQIWLCRACTVPSAILLIRNLCLRVKVLVFQLLPVVTWWHGFTGTQSQASHGLQTGSSLESAAAGALRLQVYALAWTLCSVKGWSLLRRGGLPAWPLPDLGSPSLPCFQGLLSCSLWLLYPHWAEYNFILALGLVWLFH